MMPIVDNANLELWLAIWIGAVIVLFVVRSRRRVEGSGLLSAYLITLWCICWLGASIYLLPWYQLGELLPVAVGFRESVYGLLAFVFGSLVLAPIVTNLWNPPARPVAAAGQTSLPAAYTLTGGLAYVLGSSPLGRLPTVTSILAAGQQLLVVGLCLSCWQAWQQRNTKRLVVTVGCTLLLPLVTIVNSGFLAYGAVAALTVAVFVGSFLRPRWIVILALFLSGYLGLSFYVSYMRDRGDIREVVWGGRPLADRIEQVGETIGNFEWFDPSDPAHLWRIDQRLNQNFFVGVAMNRLELGAERYALGGTIVDSVLALVPRALWPDKPVLAGSGSLVSRYTGFSFAEGTSVGVGQVMEFYINFGTLGVIVGFMVIGTVLTVLDSAARRWLVVGDWRRFALYYLVGVSFLQVGGSLVEVAGTAGASVVTVLLVNQVLPYFLPGRRARAPMRPSGAAAR
jgi:hypothetical protein